jgi:hypothetical protein
MISIGFLVSHVDGGLSMLHINDQDLVATVILYMDDFLIIANQGLIGQTRYKMKKRFRMHALPSVSCYLGMNFKHNRELHTINIHQHSNIRTILAIFRIDESIPVATPMAMKLHSRKPNEEARNPTNRYWDPSYT